MGANPKNEHMNDSDSSSAEEGEQDKVSRTSRAGITNAHEKLLESARNNRLPWIPRVLDTAADPSPEDLQENIKFQNEYKDKMRGGSKNDTIVHTLVELMVTKPWKRALHFEPLLRLILQIDPTILDVQNEDGEYAFFKAVRKRKSSLVELLCKIGPSPESLIEKKQGKDNALHQAIKYSTAKFQPTVQILIEYCKAENLKEGDDEGNTPLHLAVNHEYFVEFGKELVENIVIKYPNALDCENKSKLTPFLYLQECREKFRISRAEERKQAGKKEVGKKDDGKKGEEVVKDGKKTTEAKSLERRTTGTLLSPKDNATDRLSSKYESNTKATREPDKNETQDAKSVSVSGLSDDQILSTLHAIESFLKKFILQKFPHSDASRLLYGLASSDHNIDFNLLPVPANRHLSPQMIKKNYGFLKFESTLQYVALPNLLPLPGNSSAQEATDKEKETVNQKPNHYEKIFDWLRHDGKVKEILRIIVEDDLEQPHDDETIEKTVQGLGVEVWDWRKYDISSETIRVAAPDVKEVYLYSTGNNAVLLGWSDQDGLRNLRNLEEIKLLVKGSETSPRAKQNVEKFKERLSALVKLDRTKRLVDAKDMKSLINRPEFASQSGFAIRLDDFIREAGKLPYRDDVDQKPFEIKAYYEDDVKRPFTSKTAKAMTSDQVRAHKWLDCVDKCSQWVRNMDRRKVPVKVALIDDGVDVNHDRLRENVKKGITYSISYPGKERVTSSFYASTSGHGTLMATLIRTVCPAVELYIAKLDDARASDGYSFTAKSAAEAVKWAVRMKVDIISMSWTIEKSDKDKEKKKALAELDTALQDAASKNILMFCAARDEGLEQPKAVPYPAASQTKNIYVVGAAGPSGAASTWVNERAVHFLFPGIELRESRPTLMPPEMPVVDGSSPATALASGLAALFLTILSTDTSKSWDHYKPEGRYEKIGNIFGSVKGEKNYVQVWDLFDQYTSDPTSEGDLKKLQKMVDTMIVYSNKGA